MEKYELTILLPCLNEEKNLPNCLKKALKFLTENNIKGEILLADNGSLSKEINRIINDGERTLLKIQKM